MKIKKLGCIVAALGTSAVMALTGCTGSEEVIPNKNTIGYNTIITHSQSLTDLLYDSNNFVIFNVGSHSKLNTSFLSKKMEVCEKIGMSYGIIITPNELTEEGIYNDIDFVKGLLRDHNVDMPVYLNIDPIIGSDSLYVEMKTKLIKDFLIKCDSNHIYVGLYGSDTNLCRAQKFCGIGDYYDPDCYLVMDDKEIKYTGNYTIVKDLDGNITASQNLSDIIKSNNLNDSSRYEKDGIVIIESPDEITDIAFTCGQSVDELLGFNDMKQKDLKIGSILRTPSTIDTVSSSISKQISKSTGFTSRGIDISRHQGDSDSFDWETIANKCDYVILRVSINNELDSQFDKNVSNASSHNIPIGTYSFNTFTKDNTDSYESFIRKQKEQAQFTINALNNKKISYPVYLDVENSDLQSSIPKNYMCAMLDTWYEEITKAGYVPGLYSNKSSMDYIYSCYPELSDKFSIWLSGGPKYETDTADAPKYDIDDLEPYDPDTYYSNPPKYEVDTLQVTNRCTNAGAGNSYGCVDLNFSNITSISVVDEDANTLLAYKIKEFNPIDIPTFLELFCECLMGVSIVGTSLIVYVHNRKKNGPVRTRKA